MVSAANSGNTATWTFDGLAPGGFAVSTTWAADQGLSSSSPFTIRDGGPDGTIVAEVRINQELAPQEFDDQGVPWSTIALVPITSGTLTVQLTDVGADATANDATELVAADAIRVESVSLSERDLPIIADDKPNREGASERTPATIREGTGPDASVLAALITAFRADLGGVDNGDLAPQETGTRSVRWDQVSDFEASPEFLPPDFFNSATFPRGLNLYTAGDGFQVSKSTVAGPRFSNLNATYLAEFDTATIERLMTPIGDNVFDVTFFVPGTDTPAVVAGFGAVFTDVDLPDTTIVQYFGVDGELLLERPVLATSGAGSLSFTGVTFPSDLVGRVRITAGDGQLLATNSPNDITQGGANDLVVLDDFIYGEPKAKSAPVQNAEFSSDCISISGPGFLSDLHRCSGDQTGEYDFSALPTIPPGSYIVSASYQSGQNLSDDVRYTIDNGTELIEASVNQQIPADDFTDAGTNWERLAKVTVVEGQDPVVTVSTNAGGTFHADAIRFDPAASILQTCNEQLCWGETPNPFTVIDPDTGEARLSQTFRIKNDGPGTLVVGGFNVTGAEYSVDTSKTEFLIPPLGFTTFDINFLATGLGTFNGQLTYETNDFDNELLVLDLITDVNSDSTAPTVGIVLPEDDRTIVEGAEVSVSVDASDDVQLKNVEILVGGVVVDTLTEAPFETRVTLPTGVDTVDIGANANDVAGNTSGATPITVNLLDDQPPEVQITSPSDGQGVLGGSTIRVTADATDDLGVEQVELRVDGQPVTVLLFEPYVAEITIPDTVGDVEVEACATDTAGNVTCTTVDLLAFQTPIIESNSLVVAPDAGGPDQVRVFRPDGTLTFQFVPYPGFTGGVRVATGDVNGDGFAEIITGAGPGGGPHSHVKVFDGATGAEIRSFNAFDSPTINGVYVAAGDVTGDGIADIITSPDAGGGPHVRVFDGRTNALHAQFTPFDETIDHVRVGVEDINGDGQLDIITGPGAGGGPHIRVFDGHNVSLFPDTGPIGFDGAGGLLTEFPAFDRGFLGGVFVGSLTFGADIDGSDSGGHIRVVDGAQLLGASHDEDAVAAALKTEFFAFGSEFNGGVRVSSANINEDDRNDTIVGSGPSGDATDSMVKLFDDNGDLIDEFVPFTGFAGGVFVAGVKLNKVDVLNLPDTGGTNRVVFEGNDIVIRDSDGNELSRIPTEGAPTIRINGPSDVEDEIVLELPDSLDTPLTIDGGLGEVDRTIVLPPGEVAIVGIVQRNFGMCADGSCSDRVISDIFDDDPERRYVDIEEIEDRVDATDREFVFPDRDDDVLFDRGFVPGEFLRIQRNLDQIVDFLQASGTTTVMLGGGADIFRFDLTTDLLPIVDGEDGEDTLVLTNTDQHLDLTDPSQNQPRNIETIDIIGASPNELTIDGQSVLDVTDDDDMLVVIHDEDDTVNYNDDNWTVEAPIFVDGGQRHVLTNGDARVETINTLPFRNPLEPTDVNRSGQTSSLDALKIINFLGRFDGVASVDLPAPTSEEELPECYYDVNGSGTATALDALNVINFVGRQLLSGGEQEFVQEVNAALQSGVAVRREPSRENERQRVLQDLPLQAVDNVLSERAGGFATQSSVDPHAVASALVGAPDSARDDEIWDRAIADLDLKLEF